MPAPSNAPLNAEPAGPEERNTQHLPLKSFVDAVVQDPPANGANGINGTKGSNSKKGLEMTNGLINGAEDKSAPDKASVLRILDPDDAETREKQQEDRPQFERQESQHEYSATVRFHPSPKIKSLICQQGLDDTPRSPPRHKHRKAGSKSSNSSIEKVNLNGNDSKEELAHYSRQPNEDKTTVFEKVQGDQNGGKLVSVKPAADYEKQPRTDQKEVPKQGKGRELASGRKAGQRWETSAIRWAPMNVPLQRRLQTLVVLVHTLCIALSVSIFFFLCAIPLFWPLLIPYMIYCMASKASTSGTLKHRSEFLRSLPVWSLFASYFPARLHRTQELPPTRKYIFGYHPHGIISMGAFAAFSTEALGFSQLFPGIKNTLLTLDSNFRIPIYRDYALAMGLASVSKESCENLLSRGGPNKVC